MIVLEHEAAHSDKKQSAKFFFQLVLHVSKSPISFSNLNMNSNCSNLLDTRNLQEQVKKAFCHQKLF